MKRVFWSILAVSCVLVSAAFAQQDHNQTSGPALTIYNQNLAVVRTSVDLNLKPGNNEVTTTKVTSQLEPDSVVLRDRAGRHPVQIEEQNYDAAIATQAWMLQKYEGKTIDFQQTYVENGVMKAELIPGKILRADANGTQPLIEVNGKMQFSLPGLPVFPASTDGLLLKPTLRWEIYSKEAAQFPAELSYLTRGFNWNATYNVVAAKPEAASSGVEPVDIVGWVTISNNSGTDFENARIKLMAGDVAIRPQGYGGGMMGGMAEANVMLKASYRPVTQKSFDDFHLYDLNRIVTLKDRETKQIEFLRVTGVPVTRKYVYDGAELSGYTYGGQYLQSEMGLASTKKVHIEQEFVNSKQNHLGMPLPAGVVRFYRTDADGQMEFVGENTIDHTPEGGKVRLSTGTAFDVTGQRKRMEFHVDYNEHTMDESYLITVKNAKDKPVDVDVVEHLFRAANWEIVDKSSNFEKRDSSTVAFPVTVPAHGQQQVTYKVHYTW